jgi:hypothetical protein
MAVLCKRLVVLANLLGWTLLLLYLHKAPVLHYWPSCGTEDRLCTWSVKLASLLF